MTRVLSVSSGRADVSILAPVWRALAKAPDTELHIFRTGALAANAGELDGSVPDGVAVHAGGSDPGGGDQAGAAKAMADILADTARTIEDTDPDVVLVMGDRIDMMPAALAAVPLNVPVAHLHGGEQTLGAVDDLLRHATTKLAHLHFAASEDAAERIRRMGEESWRVHVTGAPGLDTLRMAPNLSSARFAGEIEMEDIEGLRLVTVHPETNSDAPLAPLDAVLEALDTLPGPTLFTAPNADPGGIEMRQRILAFVGERPWATYRESLGPTLYPSALRHAAVMVGNSSSGIVEAGLFGLPVINVGHRQEARLRGVNVHDCAADAAAATKLLRTVPVAPEGRPSEACTPYGDGRAAPRIAEILGDLPDRRKLLRKVFCDGGAKEAPAKRMAGGGR